MLFPFDVGIFPQALKHAIIRRHFKGPNLDSEVLKNYRPITNLAFVGKTMERAAVSQVQHYICEHELLCCRQSAYRPFSSCETAL